MQQLEIRFFYPLTEQIPLDLNFKPCEDYEFEKSNNFWGTAQSGLCLNVGNGGTVNWANLAPNTFQFKADPDSVGYWAISKDLHVWRKQKPSWLHQRMTKIFFGWEWKDK